MHLSWRDGLATVFVATGTVLALLWLAGTSIPGFTSGRPVAAIVFGLGLAASVTAVVYGVGVGLLKAPKMYLALASVLGLGATVGGVIALINGNEVMLAILVGTNVALWAISTIRHTMAPAARAHTTEERYPRAA